MSQMPYHVDVGITSFSLRVLHEYW